jgi:hypothetical protein
MYTIQPYNCGETSVTIVQAKHKKILDLRGKRQISYLQSAERYLLWQSSPVWVQLDTSVLCYCYFQEKYETRTNEWHVAWINPRVPSLGVDTEWDFRPVVSSIHKTY